MSTKAPDGSAKPLCFVIGPIGAEGSEVRKHADYLLKGIIRPVLEGEEFGYRVKRADEDADPGMISDRMISDILHAHLVVADLTGLNPNAFYELGIRHAAEKPVIHIAKAGIVLPFDNLSHRTIFVDVTDYDSFEQAKARLAASARRIIAPGYQVSNPITQANATFKMRDSADPRDYVIADIQSKLERIERELRDWRERNVPNLTPGQEQRPIGKVGEVDRDKWWLSSARSNKALNKPANTSDKADAGPRRK